MLIDVCNHFGQLFGHANVRYKYSLLKKIHFWHYRWSILGIMLNKGPFNVSFLWFLRCLTQHHVMKLHHESQWMSAERGSLQKWSQASIRSPPGFIHPVMLRPSMAPAAHTLRTDGEHRWLSPELFIHLKWKKTQHQVSHLCSKASACVNKTQMYNIYACFWHSVDVV